MTLSAKAQTPLFTYTPTPNIDTDGVADYLDKDTDNDGLTNIVEGCKNFELSSRGDNYNLIGKINTTAGFITTLSDGTKITYKLAETKPFEQIEVEDFTAYQGFAIKLRGFPLGANQGSNGVFTVTIDPPVENFFFKLADFDQKESWKVEVFDETSTAIPLAEGNQDGVYMRGQQVGHSATDVFSDILNGTSSVNDDDDKKGSVFFYFPTKKVSQLKFTITHPDNGSLRFVGMQYCQTDTDKDGYTNDQDLDSDNDAIPDLVEAGGADTDGDGKIDSFADADGDGLANIYEISPIPDTNSDADTIPNRLDIDSDNDGITDNTEAMPTLGYIAPSGIDTDKDGIDNSYDVHSGFSASNFVDTDSDGTPDYKDTDSDGDGKTDRIEGHDTNGDGTVNGSDAPNAGTGLYTAADADKDGLGDGYDKDDANFNPTNNGLTPLSHPIFFVGYDRDWRSNPTSLLDFDGADDHIEYSDDSSFEFASKFSLEAWVLQEVATGTQTIIAKSDARGISYRRGYLLSLNAGILNLTCYNGSGTVITNLSAPTAIPLNKWHHVAAIYDNTASTEKVKLYIDGIKVTTNNTATAPIYSTERFMIGATYKSDTPTTPTNYFNGYIDEVRVWRVPLSEDQLRQMMNQEIIRNGTAVKGKVIPLNITGGLLWNNLVGYYDMNTNDAKDKSGNAKDGLPKNIATRELQTAPLPYESVADGTWQTAATWKNNTTQDLPNSSTIDWNIVRTSHNVESTGDKKVLGLIVKSNTLSATNDSKIEVTNYLDLDGKIDLVGKSQLLQSLNCELDVTSAGSIERDQQGQTNKFNYNYWSSPVSAINNATNNNGFTVVGVMKDGFSSTPRDIFWNTTYDGVAGTPETAVSLAQYWLYTFESNTDAYANWVKITKTTPLRAGQGYTLKGNGGIANNFTFVGKPNNGTINTNTVTADNLLLVGNPYPSAINAYTFINDNINSVDRFQNPGVDGTLYFWEHASNNNSHVLASYLGGYAVLNLTGGIAPVVPSGISGVGLSVKIPKKYIPVGQGFFVYGKSGISGSVPVVFNNGQRAFFKEDDATNSNSLFKTRPKTAKMDHWNDNSNDTIQKDTYKRVRLGFNSNNKYHRQVLLGFMNEKATSGMDYGFDGLSLDNFPNDMYLLNGENQLVIQGEGSFNPDNSYPIGVKTDVAGKISFTMDALENFDAEQKVFIYDDETKIYNEIQNNSFEVEVPVGINNTRFSLRFKDKSLVDKTLSINEDTKTNDIKITHIQNENKLQINNNVLDVTVENVTLFTILGQSVATWNVVNKEQQNIQLPIKKMSTGIYVVKLKTTSGELSKKIIIK
ncbi:MAG: T9SS type A sorting domain-containing protein [Flavobacteriaceae bacterium]|nr:T9SS type A sorting domain-containing protein [Flavobacteriaceae bacterium]